jgi:7-cyano-7-deazaguanine synthase
VKPSNKAVVLLSGGIDSSTVLALAKKEGFEVYALTFDYGQRHAVEIESARSVAKNIGVIQHIVVRIDLRVFGGSSLTTSLAVPKAREADAMANQIPNTYVPARNTIFLSFALAWAEVLGAHHIFLGVNAVDYSGYPDCRPDFIQAYERMANLATKAGVQGTEKLTIHVPLILLTKAEIIKRGHELGIDYSMTRSCYDPSESGEACGSCDSCLIRQKGFRANGFRDPIQYRTEAHETK